MKPHLSYIYSIVSFVFLFFATVQADEVLYDSIKAIINHENLTESIPSFRELLNRKLYKDELPTIVYELQNPLLLLEMSRQQLKDNNLKGALVSYGLGLYALIDDFNKIYFEQPYDLTLFNIVILWAIENYGTNFQGFEITSEMMEVSGEKIMDAANNKRKNKVNRIRRLYRHIYDYFIADCLLRTGDYMTVMNPVITSVKLFVQIWFHPTHEDLFNNSNGKVHAIEDLPNTTLYQSFNKDVLLVSLETYNIQQFINRMRRLSPQEKEMLNVDQLATELRYPIIFFELSRYELENIGSESIAEAFYLYAEGIYWLIDNFCYINFQHNKIDRMWLNLILKWAVDSYGASFQDVNPKLIQDTASSVLSSKDRINTPINQTWIRSLYHHINRIYNGKRAPKYTFLEKKFLKTEDLFNEFWFKQ